MGVIGHLGLGHIVDVAIRNTSRNSTDGYVVNQLKELLVQARLADTANDYSAQVMQILNDNYGYGSTSRLYRQVSLLISSGR